MLYILYLIRIILLQKYYGKWKGPKRLEILEKIFAEDRLNRAKCINVYSDHVRSISGLYERIQALNVM